MKEIKALIRPFKLDAVIDELTRIEGLPGMTVDKQVYGIGKSSGSGEQQLMTFDLMDNLHMVRLEIVVPEKLVGRVIQTIREQARTGNPGDGKIFVYDVEDVIRIRTNERGDQAL